MNILRNAFISSNICFLQIYKKYPVKVRKICKIAKGLKKDSILKITTSLEKKPNKEKYLNNYIDCFYSEENISNIIEAYEKECNDRLEDVCFHAKELYDNINADKLFNDEKDNPEGDYWCAHGVAYPQSNGTVTLTAASGEHSVRCVYDDWYWGSSPVVTSSNRSPFTWGDKEITW